MFSHLSPWKPYKCVLKPSGQDSFFQDDWFEGVTCIGLLWKWMFSHISCWKPHNVLKCFQGDRWENVHFQSKPRHVTPQIDHLGKTSPVLRISTHIYGDSKEIYGKPFILRVNYLPGSPINVCWNPQNRSHFSEMIDLRITCLGLPKKWMFSHLSSWKPHKCVLKPSVQSSFDWDDQFDWSHA